MSTPLIVGYTIFDKEYVHQNYFLTILAFSIYKSYYVSEQRAKKIDVYLLFKNEFQGKMKENKQLGMNSLFKNILNKL
jgi:Gpi18-like mannosyltransferase